MVHALEDINQLLKPDGCLIDIHPIREAPFIKVFRGSDLLSVESDPGYDYDAGIQHAEAALAEVLHRGSYRVERENEFELVTSASSAPELQDYWEQYGAFDDTPKDEAMIVRKNEVYTRADEIMQNASGAEISCHERARITRLEPNVRE